MKPAEEVEKVCELCGYFTPPGWGCGTLHSGWCGEIRLLKHKLELAFERLERLERADRITEVDVRAEQVTMPGEVKP